MRTNPAGAVASGETNVLPPTTTSWKNITTSSATMAAAHPAVSDHGRRARAAAAGAREREASAGAGRWTALRELMAWKIRSDRRVQPVFDFADHPRRERRPV